MNRKKDKWKRIFLLLIISILMIVLIMNLQENEPIINKEHSAQASTVNRNKVITTSEKILTGKTIVIDAGHGGIDIGASGQNGTNEKDVTLTMAKNIKNELEKRTDANVILTRNDDVNISLADRVKVADEQKADLFVSIHFDAFLTIDVEGITTYYKKKSDEPLAALIQDHIFKNGLDARDRGVSLGDYYVLRENSSPAILLELGFISNSSDEARMISEEFQSNTTNSIVDGIIDYLNSKNSINLIE
ncbi:N-acetylmuramoyl-L-alanine amidase [Neobacillus sp. WH10]|uniref:N-acetylmuramoyl-L-alanine amidase family protein n=1 Tax=Neobacillus sp. WH10 TaxID=3047873 RepID=UPI0024C10A6D|nr:N-acetylmuramoyl-L-alanine amidase [Neobacillus sp. WH10]WHY77282.1 N-acetylmuramoyl-L-alanine amidase [Neobacillus sp. WH10]